MSDSSKSAPFCWASWKSVALCHSGCTVEELVSFKFICSNPDLGGAMLLCMPISPFPQCLDSRPSKQAWGGLFIIARDPVRACLITAWQKTTVAHLHAISNPASRIQCRLTVTNTSGFFMRPTVWERPHMIALILKGPESNVLEMQAIFTIKQKHDVFGKESSLG